MLVAGSEGAIANQPLPQCTVKIATSMVIISGTLTQRVANPINRKMPPTSSVTVASKASNQGKGRPRPQSALPNQATVESNAKALLSPALKNTGAR